jgi:beta-mannosidase
MNDLLQAGRIDDPFYRRNELDVQWVGEADWTYRRRFRVAKGFLDHDRVLLRCEGLDTLATVKVNGTVVGRADNMFRTWEFDVQAALQPGENDIEIRLASPIAYINRRAKADPKLPLRNSPDLIAGANWIRKEQCNFGWDWGPKLVTSGIWKPIRIVAFDNARLTGVAVTQQHRGGKVKLDATADVETIGRGSRAVRFTLSRNGRTVAKGEAKVLRGKASAELRIDKPELWWPNGLGDQPLYDLDVELLGAAGEPLDRTARRIGLRKLELQQRKDKDGRTFEFACNGVRFFAKGANWIPDDAILARLTREDYEYQLRSSADANMNMLRVWGGGIYEHDCFYDLCDELGICVWQDFMFACSAYPSYDEAFMASVKAEAEDNVARIAHHACLALWCGNNELEHMHVVNDTDEWTDQAMGAADYAALFEKLLPDVVKRLSPQTTYWPSSGHSPTSTRQDANNPGSGDAHCWSVWHGGEPFEWYRDCTHRFQSEFGFQSFPEPATVETFTEPADLNLTHPVMRHHQRSGGGNEKILKQMLDRYRIPEGFENLLWMSQIQQAEAIRIAVEHCRRSMPRCMGTLYWQQNDCWPVASWASIDSLGRWKALHYAARAFYAPRMVSILEDADRSRFDLWISSDARETVAGELRWSLVTPAGEVAAAEATRVDIPAGKSARALRIDARQLVEDLGAENVLCFADLVLDGQVVSSNWTALCHPRDIELQDPQISATVKAAAGGAFNVRLAAAKPAMFVWLDLGGRADFSDNWFHLHPGIEVDVLVQPDRKMTRKQFERDLSVRSLKDIYKTV